MNRLSINGRQVFEREGPRYAYYAHRVPLQDLSVLRPGENILATALTPMVDGKLVPWTTTAMAAPSIPSRAKHFAPEMLAE